MIARSASLRRHQLRVGGPSRRHREIRPFDFKRQNDLDLHIALGVENDVFDAMLGKGQAHGIEVRGPVDHGFVRSIYFRDPNGYVVELTASTGVRQEIMDPAVSKPHEALARWQAKHHPSAAQ